MISPPPSYLINTERLTVGQLLDVYAAVLTELRGRSLVRTNNVPVGDLAEHVAAMVYGGQLEPNSARSYDLTTPEGARVQVKVRQQSRGSALFSPIRSFDFDLCVFLVVDGHAVTTAREWTPDQVREYGHHREHTNGTVVSVSQLAAAGVDRTADFARAWAELMDSKTAPTTTATTKGS